jgi:hypothetical protein
MFVLACSPPPSPSPSPPQTLSVAAPTPTIPETARPSPTDALARLSSPGGTCTAADLVADTITKYGPGYGGPSMYAWQPIHNIGTECVLQLPVAIGVAPTVGSFGVASVVDAGTSTKSGNNKPAQSVRIGPGESIAIIIGGWWGPFTFSPPPCADHVAHVTRVQFPLATGNLVFNLPAEFLDVCTSPASMSVQIQLT